MKPVRSSSIKNLWNQINVINGKVSRVRNGKIKNHPFAFWYLLFLLGLRRLNKVWSTSTSFNVKSISWRKNYQFLLSCHWTNWHLINFTFYSHQAAGFYPADKLHQIYRNFVKFDFCNHVPTIWCKKENVKCIKWSNKILHSFSKDFKVSSADIFMNTFMRLCCFVTNSYRTIKWDVHLWSGKSVYITNWLDLRCYSMKLNFAYHAFEYFSTLPIALFLNLTRATP